LSNADTVVAVELDEESEEVVEGAGVVAADEAVEAGIVGAIS